MSKVITVIFGASWKSSLIGLLVALSIAVVTYAQSRPEPGWYFVALGFAALARVAKDWDKSGLPPAPPTP